MGSISNHKNLLNTPLYDWHLGHGGQMTGFGDFLLPLWYKTGARSEHLAVLGRAGLFDTSHMSSLLLEGPGAFELLQSTFSRDLNRCGKKNMAPLCPGAGLYGVFLKPDAHLLDDAIIYQLSTDSYLVCVNSGKGPVVAGHLRNSAPRQKIAITDLTAKLAKFDLQGPASARILSQIIKNPAPIFKQFPLFSCQGHFEPARAAGEKIISKNGAPLLLLRSGYTGEFGFEIFLTADKALELWLEIVDAGENFGLIPCGLAARDSLRTGAGLPLAGHDIGGWPFVNNPWSFALPYKNKGKGFSKKFIGDQAVLKAANSKFTYPFAGFDPRKIETAEASVIDRQGKSIGNVLTCVTDMGTGRLNQKLVSVNSPGLPENFKTNGICCGFIRVENTLKTGNIVTLKDQRREVEVEIVESIRPHRTARLPLDKFI